MQAAEQLSEAALTMTATGISQKKIIFFNPKWP